MESSFCYCTEPCRDFDTQYVRGEKVLAAGTLPGSDREHRRQDTACRMDHTAAVGIIEIKPMN